MCAISAQVGAIADHKAFRDLAISSLNAQMKKRTRVTSVAPDTDCVLVQSFLVRGLYLSLNTIKMYR